MATFKAWVTIERIADRDDPNDDFEEFGDVGEPEEAGEFDTEAEAENLRSKLVEKAQDYMTLNREALDVRA
jgi:hypothetical protein